MPGKQGILLVRVERGSTRAEGEADSIPALQVSANTGSVECFEGFCKFML